MLRLSRILRHLSQHAREVARQQLLARSEARATPATEISPLKGRALFILIVFAPSKNEHKANTAV
jgi:hypothetical protein